MWHTAVNSSFSLPYNNNGTAVDIPQNYLFLSVYIIIFTVGLPINSYVVRLITTGEGSGVVPELFALNASVCEIIICFNIVPAFLLVLSSRTDALNFNVGFFSTILSIGRPIFQCCVCVERYVAVVHPVVFLRYRPLRFRVAVSALMWLLVLGICTACPLLPVKILYKFLLPQYFILFSVKAFCSVAVLKALRRPGPGEKWSAKDAEANRMKRKAFRVILVIFLSVLIIYTPAIMFILLYDYLSQLQIMYAVSGCFYFLTVAGFVQPLLYLHRAGKLPFLQCF